MAMAYDEGTTTYLHTQQAIPARPITLEIGDRQQPGQFFPQLKTLHWNNECNLSVRYVDTSGETPDVRLSADGERVEYRTSTLHARFYAMQGPEEDGRFEFDLVLLARPASDVLTFSLQHKGIQACYQPPLTEEYAVGETVWGRLAAVVTETDVLAADGSLIVHRPPAVVGSYAIYHTSRQHNRTGGMHYRTGKLCHLYRPELIDALGRRSWADLRIDLPANQLTITCPSAYLATATYPVTVDPTFGYTGTGATESNIENSVIMGRFTISEDGTGDSISAIVDVTTAAHLSKYNIYQDEGGETDTNVATLANGETGETSVSTGDDQTITRAFSSAPTLTSGTVYRLASWAESVAGNYEYHSDSAVSGENTYTVTAIYGGTWPNPSGVLSRNTDVRLSIYCTYTAAAGGGGKAQVRRRTTMGVG